MAAGDARAAHGELQHLVWQAADVRLPPRRARGAPAQRGAPRRLTELLDLLPAVRSPTDPPRGIDAVRSTGWPSTAGAELTGAASMTTARCSTTLRVMALAAGSAGGARACSRYVVSFSQSAADLAAVPRAGPRWRSATAPLAPRRRAAVRDRRRPRAAARRPRRVARAAGDAGVARGGRPAVEVMLGYSDSAKDVGPLAATLPLLRRAGRARRRGPPAPHRRSRCSTAGRLARPRRRAGQPRDPRAAARLGRRTASRSPSRARSSSPATATRGSPTRTSSR